MNDSQKVSLLGRRVSRRAALAGIGSAAELLAFGIPEMTARRATAAGGIETIATSRFAGVSRPASSIDVAALLQDFPPGAYLGWHTHDGSAFAVVLNGQMTLKRGGADFLFQAGSRANAGRAYIRPATTLQTRPCGGW